MERLAEIREDRALTLRDLAEKSGVDANTINQVELGHRRPRPSTIRKLARALEVKPEELTGSPKAQAPPPPEPSFEEMMATERRGAVFTAALEHYKSLRKPINNFDELSLPERRVVFEESLRTLKSLRGVYDPEDLELALLHDVFRHAVFYMLGVYELEQERERPDAEVVDIKKYKAQLEQSA